MPNDEKPKQGQNPAPKPTDTRKNNLLNSIASLIEIVSNIPDYIEDESDWGKLRDNHWRPALREFDAIIRACADLFPTARSAREETGYPALIKLIEDKHTTDFFFNSYLSEINFISFRGYYAFTRDNEISGTMLQLNKKFEDAATKFCEPFRQVYSTPSF
jgi:hypothetical protein